MMPDKVYILSAVRSPIGTFNGVLASLKAHDLGAPVIKEAIVRASLSPDNISEVILGQVLTAAQGQNPARQSSVKAGIPYSVPATNVNMLCGSGLRSIVLGLQSIQCGDSSFVVCGGQESMSQAPHAVQLRLGIKMGAGTLTDTMMYDGLTDAFHDIPMGITAENIAKKWNVTRAEQDVFALTSQHRAEMAQNQGNFKKEILPVLITGRRGATLISEDEFPNHGTTLEKLSKLKPAFLKDGTGTVTAGNCTGINDGAAVVVLAAESAVSYQQQSGGGDCKPLATILSWAQAGVDPLYMGTGPIPAAKLALERAKWNVEEVDLWEVNEAFAAQALVVIRELGVGEEKVNVSGGAIALGHPIGASGARIVVTLIHNLQRLGKSKGVACLCVGGGMGVAMCIEVV